MVNDDKVRVFVHEACGHCQEVKRLVSEGKFNQEDVELIDTASEEGFPYVEKFQLGYVPAAFKGDKVCNLRIDRENDILDINCDQPE